MDRCLRMYLSCDVTRVRVDAAQPMQPVTFFSFSLCVSLLEASAPAQIAAVVEHVVAVWIEHPVAALARLLVVTRHLDEALVQRQIMSDRVLPALLVLAVVRKPAYRRALKLRDLIIRVF